MQNSAKISCMTTSFDDKNLELRAFPNGFMSGESKTVIDGIKLMTLFLYAFVISTINQTINSFLYIF